MDLDSPVPRSLQLGGSHSIDSTQSTPIRHLLILHELGLAPPITHLTTWQYCLAAVPHTTMPALLSLILSMSALSVSHTGTLTYRTLASYQASVAPGHAPRFTPPSSTKRTWQSSASATPSCGKKCPGPLHCAFAV